MFTADITPRSQRGGRVNLEKIIKTMPKERHNFKHSFPIFGSTLLAFFLPKFEKCHWLLGEMYHNLVRTEARKCFDTGVCGMGWDLVERTLASILLSPPVLQDKISYLLL